MPRKPGNGDPSAIEVPGGWLVCRLYDASPDRYLDDAWAAYSIKSETWWYRDNKGDYFTSALQVMAFLGDTKRREQTPTEP